MEPNTLLAQAAVVDFVARVNAAIINPILALLFTLGLLLFFWGGFIFIFNAGDEGKRAEGRQHMLWAIIGMVIMVSVFAILNVGLATFGVGGGDLPPELPLNNPVQQSGVQVGP